MATIGRFWNGHIFGTNTGKVAVTLDGDDEHISGTLRLADDSFGLAVYKIAGTYVSDELKLEGTPSPDMPDTTAAHGNLSVLGALTPEGRLDGEWSTTLGTGGTFQLHPHNITQKSLIGDGPPEQANLAQHSIGALRLYAEDVRTLLHQLTRDFSATRGVVTYRDGGAEKTVFMNDFDAVLDALPKLDYLKLSIQEHEAYGINRLAVIELVANGENVVRVQGVQESWVIGKAERLAQQLRARQKTIATQMRKFGLTINLLLFGTALAALPGIPGFTRRLTFMASIFAIQFMITLLHKRYIPNFVLYSSSTKPTIFGKIGPGLGSTFITSIGAALAASSYSILTGAMDLSVVLENLGRWLWG